MEPSKRDRPNVSADAGFHLKELGAKFVGGISNRPWLSIPELHDLEQQIRGTQSCHFLELFRTVRPRHDVNVSTFGFFEEFAAGEWMYFSESDPNLFVHYRAPGTL